MKDTCSDMTGDLPRSFVSPGAVTMVPVASIDVEDRLRPTDDDHPQAMAESIREQGLRQPITVRPRKGTGGSYRLVIGAHRLRAFEILGLPEIPAFVVDADDLHARLMEIDENLCSRRLEPLDRAIFLAERKKVYEEIHPEAAGRAVGGYAKSASAKMAVAEKPLIFGFAEEVHDRIGLSSRVVYRAIQISAGLTPDVRTRLQRHRHWTEKDLLALSKMPPNDQSAVVDEALRTGGAGLPDLSAALKAFSGKATKAKVDDGGFGKLLSTWERATAPAKAAFLAHLREAGVIPGEVKNG